MFWSLRRNFDTTSQTAVDLAVMPKGQRIPNGACQRFPSALSQEFGWRKLAKLAIGRL